MQVVLAQDDGAGGFQVTDHRRVKVGHVVAQDARAHRRWHAGHVEEVLDPEGHAVQRTAPAAVRDFALGLPSGCARLIWHDADVAIQARVEPLDAFEIRVRQLNGRQPPLAQQRRHSADVEITDVVADHAGGPGVDRSGGSTAFKSA